MAVPTKEQVDEVDIDIPVAQEKKDRQPAEAAGAGADVAADGTAAAATTKGKKAKGTGRAARPKKGGALLLKVAADRELAEITKLVVEELGKKAAAGDLSSLKTLISLSEQAPVEKPKKRGLTLVELLRAEPEFIGPVQE